MLAPLALITAYLGDWPFALFWASRRHRRVVGMDHAGRRPAPPFDVVGLRQRDRGRRLGRLARPPDRGDHAGRLGALAALIFAPRERRLWITAGIGYAGVHAARADAAAGR